jgi:hypothetical protein
MYLVSWRDDHQKDYFEIYYRAEDARAKYDELTQFEMVLISEVTLAKTIRAAEEGFGNSAKVIKNGRY